VVNVDRIDVLGAGVRCVLVYAVLGGWSLRDENVFYILCEFY